MRVYLYIHTHIRPRPPPGGSRFPRGHRMRRQGSCQPTVTAGIWCEPPRLNPSRRKHPSPLNPFYQGIGGFCVFCAAKAAPSRGPVEAHP